VSHDEPRDVTVVSEGGEAEGAGLVQPEE